MKILILVLCVLVPLSACQSNGGAGSGPLKLAPEIQALFREYMKNSSPSVFVVSTDGDTAVYLYCPDVYDGCIPGINTFHAIEDCEKDSGGVPCKIYAKGRSIVWKGASD